MEIIIFLTHYAASRKPFKGDRFRGRLGSDHEGQLLCRMLKAAFRRGLMFILGKRGEVDLDGVSLYNGSVNNCRYSLSPDYYDYVRTLQAELAAKGITRADIDLMEKLEETFAVDGPMSR
ncbi:uncharacterized protein LOC128241701 [Mya arenaria]|uniref:uncharacterized protein LOC128241701 n=1 Tax=Mya arenaria TaxID=6604 RepID=UPI0022E208A5|nr:uncharacterized protein LOC128241701 [Mya arenaria]XP_052814701.1 uncharacterized protein LOC128241701 [Mya arenaria]